MIKKGADDARDGCKGRGGEGGEGNRGGKALRGDRNSKIQTRGRTEAWREACLRLGDAGASPNGF